MCIRDRYYPAYFDKLLALTAQYPIEYYILGQHNLGNEIGDVMVFAPFSSDEDVYKRQEYADLLQNYFGMTEEQFNEEALNVVKQNLDAEMYLKAIAEKEGIEVRDDDYEAACQRLSLIHI